MSETDSLTPNLPTATPSIKLTKYLLNFPAYFNKKK